MRRLFGRGAAFSCGALFAIACVAVLAAGCSRRGPEASPFAPAGRIGIDGALGVIHVREDAVRGLLGTRGHLVPRGFRADVFLLDEEIWGAPVAMTLSGARPDLLVFVLELLELLEREEDDADRYRLRWPAGPGGALAFGSGSGPARRWWTTGDAYVLKRVDIGKGAILTPTVDLWGPLEAVSESVELGWDGDPPELALTVDGPACARYIRRAVLPAFEGASAVAELATGVGDATRLPWVQVVSDLARRGCHGLERMRRLLVLWREREVRIRVEVDYDLGRRRSSGEEARSRVWPCMDGGPGIRVSIPTEWLSPATAWVSSLLSAGADDDADAREFLAALDGRLAVGESGDGAPWIAVGVAIPSGREAGWIERVGRLREQLVESSGIDLPTPDRLADGFLWFGSGASPPMCKPTLDQNTIARGRILGHDVVVTVEAAPPN